MISADDLSTLQRVFSLSSLSTYSETEEGVSSQWVLHSSYKPGQKAQDPSREGFVLYTRGLGREQQLELRNEMIDRFNGIVGGMAFEGHAFCPPPTENSPGFRQKDDIFVPLPLVKALGRTERRIPLGDILMAHLPSTP